MFDLLPNWLRYFIACIMIVVLISFVINAPSMVNNITDTNVKVESCQIINCSSNENSNIFTFFGISDNTEYTTYFNLNGTVVSSSNKDIYNLCKDSVNENVSLEIEYYGTDFHRVIKVKELENY